MLIRKGKRIISEYVSKTNAGITKIPPDIPEG